MSMPQDHKQTESPPQAEWIDWLAFCDKESTRYALDAPWVKDGWKFATDSRVMIAVPTGEPDSQPDAKGRRFANALPLIKPALRPGIKWQPLPAFERCGKCSNKGTIRKTCSCCRGATEVQCDMGHYHDCPDCDKTGKETLSCRCFVVLGNRCLATEYFEKVAALPNVKWHSPNDKCESPVFFSFGELGNCVAVVIPLSSEHHPECTERKSATT